MDKYIDFYGFGIKDGAFHNAWGDNRVLILRKSGKYGLGKSNTLGKSTHYVRFLTRADAQNFIDNYIPTDPDLSGGEYSIYKVKYNRPAVLWDSKYNVYATTYNLPAGRQLAQYDKTNTLVASSISVDNITVEYVTSLMDQLDSSFKSNHSPISADADAYLKWLGLPNGNRPANIIFPQTFSCADYRVIPGKSCLEISGEMLWNIGWWDYLTSLHGSPYEFFYHLYSTNYDLHTIIRRGEQYKGKCIFQLDLEKFKDFIRFYEYTDFKVALKEFIEHITANLLFYKPLYDDTKDSFESMKQNILKTYNIIKEEYDSFNEIDVLESVDTNKYDVKIGQQFKKEPIEGSGSVYTASLVITRQTDPENDEPANKHKILMSFGFNEGKKALQFVDWPAIGEDAEIENLIVEFYEQLHLKQLSSSRWLSPINNIDEDPALLEEIVINTEEALQEWLDNN